MFNGKKSRLTTNRPSNLKQIKRNNNTKRLNIKVPLRTPSPLNVLKRKNFNTDQTQQSIREFPRIQPKQNDVDTKIHRVCYITNWSRYRSGEAKFEIEYIDPFMCSHIIYAYATIDDHRPEIIPIQKEDIGKK
jgi:hypothetical protein